MTAVPAVGRRPWPGAGAQVWQLFRFRWSTLSAGGRAVTAVAVLVGVVAVPLALAVGATGWWTLPRDRVVEATGVTPGLLLVLCLGLVVSAVASPGGRQVVPRQQLVAFPVSATAEHLAGLLLAPANLAWAVQVTGAGVLVGLFAADEAATAGAGAWAVVVAAGVLFVALVAAVTALGQCLAWVVEIVRTLPGGVWAVRLLTVAVVAAGVLFLRADVLVRMLEQAPTAVLTDQVSALAAGEPMGAAVAVSVLVVVTAVAVACGAWLYRVLLQRPTRDQTRSETSYHRLRPLPVATARWSELRSWRAQDWASVWRSVPLRRGLLLLVIAPALGGVLARIAWPDLVLLGAVVSAGASLLFGINMFALDGEGAIWRTSLPTAPRVWLISRALVVAEIVVLTSTVTMLAASVSARGAMTAAAVTVAVVAVPTMTLQVVSRCVRWSITHPERAELREARDSPVSPGRMMTASVRLMAPTMGMGVVLAVVARTGLPWLAVLVVIPSWLLCLRSLRVSARRWDDESVRARVVQSVSRG